MNKNVIDICIIGSGPAGLTAALYAAQADLNVCIISGPEPGGNLPKINCLTNYLGFKEINGPELVDKILNDQLPSYKNLDIIYDCVTSITKNELFEITTEFENTYYAKSIILATGLTPKTLGLNNEEQFLNHGLSYCATCDGPFFKDKDVFVIGGGNTAVEYATTLSKICNSVLIIYRKDKLRATAEMRAKISKTNNIGIYYCTEVKELIANEQGNLKSIIVENNCTHEQEELKGDGIFYALGYEMPKLLIDPSIEGVFIAGDLTEDIKQVAVASGSGCKAALNCIEFLKK